MSMSSDGQEAKHASPDYCFNLIAAFCPPTAPGATPPPFRRETVLNNFENVSHLLADVDWEAHGGLPPPYGGWPPGTADELAQVGRNRAPLVLEACRSGRFNAVVLLGGGDPGYLEARRIGADFGVPVTSCAHAQMTVAGQLGRRFSFLCLSEFQCRQTADLVADYGMSDRCAPIRNLGFLLEAPSDSSANAMAAERRAAAIGGQSRLLDLAVGHAKAAVEEDGAETILISYSQTFWLQPHLSRLLAASGHKVPVLEGNGCAIAQAKLMVGLGVCGPAGG
jgi:allantoin racemase